MLILYTFENNIYNKFMEEENIKTTFELTKYIYPLEKEIEL